MAIDKIITMAKGTQVVLNMLPTQSELSMVLEGFTRLDANIT